MVTCWAKNGRFLFYKGTKEPMLRLCELSYFLLSGSVKRLYCLPHFGVMPKKISKFIPGIGRESTDRYSSLKRLFMEPFRERSAQRVENVFSNVILLMKYSGSVPVSMMSLLVMV